jgi:2'-5' RNA ligase
VPSGRRRRRRAYATHPNSKPVLVVTRVQLSLFVPPEVGVEIEAVRRVVDPEQSRLIPAHVTLCREDELAGHGLADVESRLVESRLGPLTLRFGAPETFHEHGILLPCIEGASMFGALREHILAPHHVRPHAPHMTLAHPRNLRVSENRLANTASLPSGLTITFTSVQVIEQSNGGPWVVRRTVPLSGTAA